MSDYSSIGRYYFRPTCPRPKQTLIARISYSVAGYMPDTVLDRTQWNVSTRLIWTSRVQGVAEHFCPFESQDTGNIGNNLVCTTVQSNAADCGRHNDQLLGTRLKKCIL